MPQPPLKEEYKIELKRRVERTAAAQRIFNCPDGELVLDEIKSFCNGETFIFDHNHPNPTTLAYNVGKRDVLTCITNMLNADLEAARKKLNEAQERKD